MTQVITEPLSHQQAEHMAQQSSESPPLPLRPGRST